MLLGVELTVLTYLEPREFVARTADILGPPDRIRYLQADPTWRLLHCSPCLISMLYQYNNICFPRISILMLACLFC